jgi:UDP-glucose 4-epimerase
LIRGDAKKGRVGMDTLGAYQLKQEKTYMAILVLGGTGFVGSRLSECLVRKGEQVICFDLFPNPDRVLHLGERVKVVAGDVTHIEEIIAVMKEFQVERIINLAYILPPVSEEKFSLATSVNIMGMNNVLEAARLMGIKRVVYASTISIYAPQSFYGDRPVTEEDLCLPTGVYGAHKVLNEFMAKKYMDRYGMTCVGLRLSIVSGSGRKRGVMGWSGEYIDNPVIGKPVEIPLRSDQRVIVIYVDDVAEMFVSLCFAESLRHSVYNSGGYHTTLRELIEAAREVLPNAVVRFDESALDLPLIYSCSNERLEKEFQMKLPPLGDMVKRHFNEARRE